MTKTKTLIFIFLYYLVWFSCLYLAYIKQAYYALIISSLISSYQCSFFITHKNAKAFLLWLITFSLAGYLVDSIFQTSGIILFYNNSWGPTFAPPWILALWINFSVLCFGLRDFLINQLRYMMLLGLLGFPLAYSCGVSLNLAEFNPGLGLLIQGLVWSLLLPIFILLLKKLNSYE